MYRLAVDDLPLFFEMIRSLSRWDGKDVQLVRVRLRILLLEDLDGHRHTLGRRSHEVEEMHVRV